MSTLLRCIVGSVLLWASVLALPATAWAQAEDEPFRRGLSARGDKKWPEMAAAMREAIAINRTESLRKVRTGIIRIGGGTEYLPHYFLAEALRMQNECAAAVREYETSEDQKIVQGIPEFATGLRAGYKECATKGVLLRDEYRQQANATDQVYNETVALFTRIAGLKQTSADLWKADFDPELERARSDLALAQKGISKARESRMTADFAESRNLSVRAGNVLRPLESRLGAAINTRTQISQLAAETQQALAGAETTDRAVDATKIPLTGALAASRDSARALVRRARDRLASAEKTQNTTTAAEALRLAQEASDAFSKLLEEVTRLARGEFEQRFQQVVAAASEQFSFVASSLATLDRLVAEKPGMMSPAISTEREAVRTVASSLQRRFDNARRTENLAGVDEAMRLAVEARTRIDALIKAFGPATLRDRGVREPLEAGARLYFSGEYQQALDTLAPLEGMSDVPLQLHAYLLRAASLYALYVRSGETNQALRTAAVAAIQRCKEIDSAFQPSAKAFSPRFIGFFQNPGAAVESAATAPSQ